MNSKRLFSIAGNRFAVAAIAATVAGIFPGADRVGAQLLIPDWDLDHIVYLDVPTGETSVYAGVPAGSSPHHVAVDAQGRLYVSVRYRDMNVLRLTPDGAGGWTTENFTGTIGDFGPGELLFDADGHLVVSGDRPARVFRYDTTTGALVDSFTRSGANVLNAAAIDGDMLYVIEVFRSFLVEFDLSRNPVTSRVVLTDTERLERSGDVTLVAPGRVLISSTRNPTVQEYSLPEGNFVRTFLDVRSLGEETAGNITYVPHLDRYYLVRGNKVHELGPDGELLRTIVSDHLQNGTRAELLPDAIPDQTIDFPQPPNRTYGDPDFDLVATASSGLPVTFTLVARSRA